MTGPGPPRYRVTDPTLREQLEFIAEIVRSAARRWRFRADAGRVDAHPLEEVLHMLELLDSTARNLESAAQPAAKRPPPDADGIERSRVREELRRSEERFRLLVDGVRDYAIFMLDPEGRVVSWNSGAERLKGYSAEEILGEPYARFYTPEERERRKPDENLHRAALRGQVRDEGWRIRKDGTQFWAEILITALRDPEGNLVGFAKVTRDATERHRAEQALRESEECFRLLVQRVRDYAIFMLDSEGHVVSWNEGAERIKGYAAHEIIGNHFSLFYPREDVLEDKPRRVLETAARDGRFEEESWRVRKDGSVFWADVVVTPVRDDHGNLRGFAKVVRDLSDRKRAEEARRFLYDATVLLASALELQKTLHDVAHLVVPRMADWCLVDLLAEDGTIRQVAAAHVDPEKSRLAEELARRHPPQPELNRGVAHVIRSGKAEIYPDITDSRWLGELLGAEHPQILRELGALSYLCVPLVARGRVLGALTFVRAASGYRYGEEDLRNAEELGRRAGLIIDNSRLYEEAQAALRARDEFLAIAAHELRTPVTTLQLGIDGIERMVGAPESDGIDGRLRSTIETLDRQTARLAALVEGMLDVSRMAAGGLNLERETFDLADAVREEVERHRLDARRAGCEIRMQIASVLGSWDRTRVEQIVTNLLSNAFKYGAGKPIDVTLEQRGDRAILSVRDYGIGIPPERLPDIFARFERAVSLRAYGGLGLGLHITRQIVEAHGGQIDVATQPAAGATFTVELPVIQDAELVEGGRSEPTH